MKNLHALLSVVALCSCGGTRAPDTRAWDDEVAASRQRVSEYQALTSAAQTATACVAERDRYAGDLGPRLRRMGEMSALFDGCFTMMSRQGFADVEGMCSDLQLELDRYAGAGCASPDAAENRSAALEHCGRMLGWLDRAASRSASMRDMLGGGATMGMCRQQ